jgi:hypothetical protein
LRFAEAIKEVITGLSQQATFRQIAGASEIIEEPDIGQSICGYRE